MPILPMRVANMSMGCVGIWACVIHYHKLPLPVNYQKNFPNKIIHLLFNFEENAVCIEDIYALGGEM